MLLFPGLPVLTPPGSCSPGKTPPVDPMPAPTDTTGHRTHANAPSRRRSPASSVMAFRNSTGFDRTTLNQAAGRRRNSSPIRRRSVRKETPQWDERAQLSERMEPTLDPAPKRRPLSGNGHGDDLNPVVLDLDAHHDIAPTAFLAHARHLCISRAVGIVPLPNVALAVAEQ